MRPLYILYLYLIDKSVLDWPTVFVQVRGIICFKFSMPMCSICASFKVKWCMCYDQKVCFDALLPTCHNIASVFERQYMDNPIQACYINVPFGTLFQPLKVL